MKNYIVFKAAFFLALVSLIAPAYANSTTDNPRETPVVKVVRNNAESVVNISTEHIVLLRENPYWGSYGNEMDLFFGQFFRFQRPTRALKLKSVGSGVVIDRDGLIVTNAHVVNRASNIFVILNDGKEYEGRIVYENPKDDLALIKVKPANPLKAVSLGVTDDVMIGETVVAIGNPLGLENSVTAGVISGKDREVQASNGMKISDGLLQTDAPINPGNSGGALLNINGELIGVNVAVVQNSQSIGFAIPVEKVKEAMQGHAQNKQFAVKHRQQRAIPRTVIPKQDHSLSRQQSQWDPSSQMERMQREMDQLFQSFFSQRGTGTSGMGVFNTDVFYSPDLDMEERKDGYVINFDIKGVDQEKLNIEINDYSLTISGQMSEQREESSAQRFFSSKSIGSFMKTIPLPEDVDTNGIKSDIKEDKLIIFLPKSM